LAMAGYEVLVEVWDPADGKGIDDVLAHGGTVETRPIAKALKEIEPPSLHAGADAPPEGPPPEEEPPPGTQPDDVLAHDLGDIKAALAWFLEATQLRALEKASRERPGEYTAFLFRLKAAGATQRDVDALNRAVNRQGKREKEQARASQSRTSVPRAAGGPEEELTDPHRLARAWIAQCASHPDRPTVAYHRARWYRWRGGRWRLANDATFRAELTAFVKCQL